MKFSKSAMMKCGLIKGAKMTKVLVTGGGGYLGSHIVRSLEKANYDVVVMDNFKDGFRDAVRGRKLVVGDILDPVFMKSTFEDHKFDAVIHSAGLVAASESMENPEKFFQVNVGGAMNLLRFARMYGIHRFVFSSAAAVYGEPRNMPIKEDEIKVPINYYGRSKLMVEQMLMAYNTAYRFKSVSLRYFNACGADSSGEIGEDHRPETHLIPRVIQAAMGKRDSVKVYGTSYPTPDGTCIRDYIHVSDLADAHVLALKYLEDNGITTALNLGSDKGRSVMEVIETVKKVTGKDFKIERLSKLIGEPAQLVASSRKARSALGWNPKYTFEDAISSAYNWHKNHPKGFEK
jgi:UDP-glucose 4-epimerase